MNYGYYGLGKAIEFSTIYKKAVVATFVNKLTWKYQDQVSYQYCLCREQGGQYHSISQHPMNGKIKTLFNWEDSFTDYAISKLHEVKVFIYGVSTYSAQLFFCWDNNWLVCYRFTTCDTIFVFDICFINMFSVLFIVL